MLNRSLENDLNRISVVAEDADEEGNGEIGKLLHPCQRDKGNYSAQWQPYVTRGFVQRGQIGINTGNISILYATDIIVLHDVAHIIALYDDLLSLRVLGGPFHAFLLIRKPSQFALFTLQSFKQKGCLRDVILEMEIDHSNSIFPE